MLFRTKYGSAILRAPEPEPGAGGSGGAGGNEPAAPFSPEQITALGQLVNGAVKDHIKRSLTSATLGPAISESLKAMNWGEVLGPEIQKLVPAPQGGDKGKGKGGGSGDEESELQKQLRALQEKLDQQTQKAEAAERMRAETEQKRHMDAAENELRNGVAGKVREDMLDVALGHWTKVEGRLKLDDDGKPTLRVKKAQFKGAPEVDEHLPLAEAIPLLLASPEVKRFLPAPGGQQGPEGQRQQTRRPILPTQQPQGQPLSETAKAAQVLEALEKAGIDPNEAFR